MSSAALFSTASVRYAFTEEIANDGGSVTDCFDDGTRLYLRSIQSGVETVARDDRVLGGIALRMLGSEAWVYPYVFRVICSNGAIIAHVDEGQYLSGLDLHPPKEAMASLRAAIRACSAQGVLQRTAACMRELLGSDGPSIMRALMQPRSHIFLGEKDMAEVLRRWVDGRDDSAYGLMNAVTSVARDTEDPETKWRLEEIGGWIALQAALLASRGILEQEVA